MDKTSKMLLKIVGFIVSFTTFSWLLPQIETISNNSFNIWLGSTILAFGFAVFFVCWIAETIVNWNKK